MRAGSTEECRLASAGIAVNASCRASRVVLGSTDARVVDVGDSFGLDERK